MPVKPFHENRFDSIQILRGIAALFVVLEHIRFLNCGAFGVDIFFCISGFMIMFTTQKSTRFFLCKRILRIVPLYWLATIGTFLLLLLFPGMFRQSTANTAYLIKSLLFIPFDIGGGTLQPLMRIGWTVNCEMFFYLLFFIAFHLNHKYRGVIVSGLILFIFGAAQILPVNFAPLSFYGNAVMLEFILGILVYYACFGIWEINRQKPLPRWVGTFGLVAVLFLFFLLLWTKPTIDVTGIRRPFVWGIPAALIVLSVFVAGVGMTNQALHRPSAPGFVRFTQTFRHSLVQLGNMSFSLYLVHYYPVMVLDRLVFDFSACTPYTLFGTAVCIAVSVALAYLIWYLIEQKLTGFLRRILLP